mmetsp:Transcript_53770/g.103984  ORF Transcript_53770/g.103984 Transcript_53770/m.103984 type:complete len:181 (+) Transcript_53770:72-614(+)
MPFTSAASILVLSVLNPALPAVWARHQQHDAGWSAGGDENTAPTKRNFLLVARDLLHKAAAEGQARNSAHGSQAAKAWVIPPAEAVSEQSRLTATSRPVTMAHQPLWLHPDRLRQQQQQQQKQQTQQGKAGPSRLQWRRGGLASLLKERYNIDHDPAASFQEQTAKKVADQYRFNLRPIP